MTKEKLHEITVGVRMFGCISKNDLELLIAEVENLRRRFIESRWLHFCEDCKEWVEEAMVCRYGYRRAAIDADSNRDNL